MAGAERQVLMRGVGLAFLGRLGAVIEAVSFPLFLALYGPVLFGIYATAWAAARLAAGITQMGMVLMLQQFVPASEQDPDRLVAILRFALTRALIASLVVVGGVTVAAPWLAPLVDRSGALGAEGPLLIAAFAWIVPAWTMLEVLTGAIRALRRFGPEIRVRIFYEQILRLGLGAALAMGGFTRAGLFLAHLGSAAMAAGLAFALVRRNYDLRRWRQAGLARDERRVLWNYALPLMPSELIQRGFSELPVVILNALLPGARGAVAAGYYAVARKIASVMQLVFNAFDYVMAPLAAHHLARADHARIADLHGYSTRLMLAAGTLLAAGLVAASDILAALMGRSAAVIAPTLSILVLGRLASFLFGQSQAVLRAMVGSRPVLVNWLAGLGLMLLLVTWLAPIWGPPGAAVGAAAGLVLTHGLAAGELYRWKRLATWDRQLLRPFGSAMLLGGLILALDRLLEDWLAPPVVFVILLASLLLAFVALVRYGLTAEDAGAFGRLGRILRKERRRT
ncbi:MAG: hypothetical protein D6740_03675 [Alphaproteobacteria bacterium]|nr:MAG: hypothetical protein D6740_03675 [Alphaproteobacteria bacterium]